MPLEVRCSADPEPDVPDCASSKARLEFFEKLFFPDTFQFKMDGRLKHSHEENSFMKARRSGVRGEEIAHNILPS